MSTDELKEIAKVLTLQKGSKHEYIRSLIVNGFFDIPRTTEEIISEVRSLVGKKLKSIEIQPYMKKFMAAGIIYSLNYDGQRGNFWVLASIDKETARRLIGKNQKTLKIEADLFSEKLLKKLGKDFQVDISELQDNFGKNGTCTAFLLRKILEKLIFISFAKNGLPDKLEDKTRKGFLVGLEEMLQLAIKERGDDGTPFLTGRTMNELKGVKFLGDASAHNPLTNVDMKTILLQMPYIITAYEELSKKL